MQSARNTGAIRFEGSVRTFRRLVLPEICQAGLDGKTLKQAGPRLRLKLMVMSVGARTGGEAA